MSGQIQIDSEIAELMVNAFFQGSQFGRVMEIRENTDLANYLQSHIQLNHHLNSLLRTHGKEDFQEKISNCKLYVKELLVSNKNYGQYLSNSKDAHTHLTHLLTTLKSLERLTKNQIT